MHWAPERGEGRRDLQPEKAHRLTTAATSGFPGALRRRLRGVRLPARPTWDRPEPGS